MINAKTQMENSGGWGRQGKMERALRASWRRQPSVESVIGGDSRSELGAVTPGFQGTGAELVVEGEPLRGVTGPPGVKCMVGSGMRGKRA